MSDFEFEPVEPEPAFWREPMPESAMKEFLLDLWFDYVPRTIGAALAVAILTLLWYWKWR